MPVTPQTSPVGFGCGRGARDPGVGQPSVGVCATGAAQLGRRGRTVGGWLVLAINAQLWGSGLEAEAALWAWLEEQACLTYSGDQSADRATATQLPGTPVSRP